MTAQPGPAAIGVSVDKVVVGGRDVPVADLAPLFTALFGDDWRAEVANRLVRRVAHEQVIRVHYGDPDAHAESWNEGWDEAHRQGVGGQESREWVIRKLRPFLGDQADAAADALLSDADLDPEQAADEYGCPDEPHYGVDCPGDACRFAPAPSPAAEPPDGLCDCGSPLEDAHPWNPRICPPKPVPLQSGPRRRPDVEPGPAFAVGEAVTAEPPDGLREAAYLLYPGLFAQDAIERHRTQIERVAPLLDRAAKAEAAPSGELLPLTCPYCGGKLTVDLETKGSAYLTFEVPESISCDEINCGAEWLPDGTPRELPAFVKHPDLYSRPGGAS